MHAGYRIADRHRVPGIAVIATADGRKSMFFLFPLRLPILDCHLHGDFHRNGTAVGKEYLFHGGR